jgi:hypothetical protein
MKRLSQHSRACNGCSHLSNTKWAGPKTTLSSSSNQHKIRVFELTTMQSLCPAVGFEGHPRSRGTLYGPVNQLLTPLHELPAARLTSLPQRLDRLHRQAQVGPLAMSIFQNCHGSP